MTTVTFDEMFTTEFPRLVALGTSMCGDREVARELAQETMIRAYERWDDVARYERPDAWLRRVMSNLLIDHHRSATSERAALGRLGTRLGRDPAPPPPSVVSSVVSSDWRELVAALTPTQRVAATLYYGEDRSVADIAEWLGVSEGTVKSTLSKARRHLAARLEESS